MRFRLATSGAGGGGQELAGGVGNLFRSLAMAPAMAAQASEQARDAQSQFDLRGAQTALYQGKAGELADQRERGTVGSLLTTGMMEAGVPMPQQRDFGNFMQTGQMPGQYVTPADGVGPVLPAPKMYQDDTAARILQTLGLTQRAMAMGDKDSMNVAQAVGAAQDRGLEREAAEAGRRGDDMLMSRLNTVRGKKEFTPFKAVESTGTALNEITGEQDVANAGLRAIFGDKAAAEMNLRKAQTGAANASAASSYASAENSRASAEKTRRAVAAGTADGGRPLSSTALKMQAEGLEAIGLASSIQADLDAVEQQLELGTLDLGPVANLQSRALNASGFSTESSRNFGSFQSTLEKMRNDSLRLNSGVQTEGDAQRAWNELLAGINDPVLVKQRIGEIKRINQRAAELKKLNVDMIRANFGKDPIDASGFTNVAPALGPGATPSAVDPLGIRRK